MEDEILQTMEDFLKDNQLASELRKNGSYLPAPKRRRPAFSVQEQLINQSEKRAEKERLVARSGRTSGKTEDQCKTD